MATSNTVRTSSTCLLSVARNRYSVPCERVGQWASSRLYPSRIVVIADETVVTSSKRLFDQDQLSFDWQHYISLIERKPGDQFSISANNFVLSDGGGLQLRVCAIGSTMWDFNYRETLTRSCIKLVHIPDLSLCGHRCLCRCMGKVLATWVAVNDSALPDLIYVCG